jgi:hypothetical protein
MASRVDAESEDVLYARGLVGLRVALSNTDTAGGSTTVRGPRRDVIDQELDLTRFSLRTAVQSPMTSSKLEIFL